MKPVIEHTTKRCKICGYRVRGKGHAEGNHHKMAEANMNNRRKAVKE